MARSSNSNRSKRKYGDKRKAATARNHEVRRIRAQTRHDRLVERTKTLIGGDVRFRATGFDRPLVGRVAEILRKGDERYPKDAKRNSGSYLVIDVPPRMFFISRHRVTPVK